MKTKLTLLILLLMCRISAAQNTIPNIDIEQGINPSAPLLVNSPVQSNTPSFTNLNSNGAGLTCGTTTFWGMVGTDAVEFSLSGTTIIQTG